MNGIRRTEDEYVLRFCFFFLWFLGNAFWFPIKWRNIYIYIYVCLRNSTCRIYHISFISLYLFIIQAFTAEVNVGGQSWKKGRQGLYIFFFLVLFSVFFSGLSRIWSRSHSCSCHMFLLLFLHAWAAFPFLWCVRVYSKYFCAHLHGELVDDSELANV